MFLDQGDACCRLLRRRCPPERQQERALHLGLGIVARFALENRGSVPGVLTSWRLEARAGQQVLAQPHRREAPGLALAVVAGGSHPMPEIEVDVADRDAYYREERSITFEAEARYEGLGARPYATRVVTELTFNKDAMRYETREIKFE